LTAVSTSSGATANQRFRTLEGISTSLDRTSVVDGEDVLGVVLQAVPERESNSTQAWPEEAEKPWSEYEKGAIACQGRPVRARLKGYVKGYGSRPSEAGWAPGLRPLDLWSPAGRCFDSTRKGGDRSARKGRAQRAGPEPWSAEERALAGCRRRSSGSGGREGCRDGLWHVSDLRLQRRLWHDRAPKGSRARRGGSRLHVRLVRRESLL
jgi:hypothetical protein